jgi:hypothetical protein
MTEKGVPMETGAYPQYTEGLLKIMHDRSITLEQAKKIALKEARDTKGYEQIPFIKAAYNELKKNILS